MEYQGGAQIPCTLHDLTHDYAGVPGAPGGGVGATMHYTTLTLGATFPTDAQGWQVILGTSFVATYGGDTVSFPINVQTTPQINTQDFEFEVLANYTGPNNEKLNQTLVFRAEVNEYDIAFVQTKEIQKRAGQNEVVKYEIEVTNLGVYPDVYQISVTAPSRYHVSIPPSVYVPPGQTRNVTVSLLTPKDKLYELGKSEAFIFSVSSTRGTGVYSTVGLLKLSGPYVPSYWIPLLAVALVAGAITVTKARDRTEIRRLERGRPRRVALTPRQEVLLAELKKADPEAYKARKAQLAAVYVARRAQYRDAHREQVARDRAEHKQAREEFKAAKKRQAMEAKEKKRAETLDRKAERSAAALAAKDVKRKEKELRKKQRLVEKARKKQARLDAKQAKADAKAAAKDLAAQAKADKAAAREAKRAAKAAKKRPPEGNA